MEEVLLAAAQRVGNSGCTVGRCDACTEQGPRSFPQRLLFWFIQVLDSFCTACCKACCVRIKRKPALSGLIDARPMPQVLPRARHVAFAAAVAGASQLRGQQPADCEEVSCALLRRLGEDRLPSHMVPSVVIAVASLPMTGTGKAREVQRSTNIRVSVSLRSRCQVSRRDLAQRALPEDPEGQADLSGGAGSIAAAWSEVGSPASAASACASVPCEVCLKLGGARSPSSKPKGALPGFGRGLLGCTARVPALGQEDIRL